MYLIAQRQIRIKTLNALQLRRLLLLHKGFRGLTYISNLLNEDFTIEQTYITYRHLLRRYFLRMRIVCKQILPLERLQQKRALLFYKLSTLKTVFNLALKPLLARKRLTYHLARSFRDTHKNRLLIKSFSGLLFNKLEMKKKQPLVFLQTKYIKLRLFRKWLGQHKNSQRLEERLRILRFRKNLLQKRQIMINLYLQTQKLKDLKLIHKVTLRKHMNTVLFSYLS